MRARFDASGEVLVVTGGAAGIGRALALAFARSGGTSVVFDVAAGDDVLNTASGVEIMSVDVSDRIAVESAVATVIERHGRIDALVAGAAVQPRSTVLAMSPEEWRRVQSINLDGAVWVIRAVTEHMRSRREGSIVVFTSGMALTGFAEASAYNASKAALVGFAKSLAAELVDDRVRVNVISPGVIDTDQFREANIGADLDHWKKTTGIGSPEDVVGPLLFLLSDASTMTGSQLTRERVYPAEGTTS